MTRIVFTGTGAAPGVPSVSKGWGACNPNNPKNCRRRIGTYIEIDQQKILIDTSPDLRSQLLDHQIKYIDAVLYTHAHADHVHGIDDLRELNRLMGRPIDFYGSEHTVSEIKKRFSYLIDDICENCGIFKASLKAHALLPEQDLYLGNTKINLFELKGHLVPSNGYLFNDGEIVFVADCREITEQALKKIKVKPKILVMPLTTINTHYAITSHMGLDKLLEYVNLIKPEMTIINHMASECDYDKLNNMLPSGVQAAYDNMVIEF